MANDNKIKIGKAEVKLFLSNEMLPSENDSPILYDLEAEYAKTKKRKSLFTIWVLLACTAVVVLLTFCVTKYIEYKNNNLSVGIQVFEDLNLKNLLDVVSRTEGTMKEVTNKKIQLESEKHSLVSQAEVKKQGDLELLDSLRLSSSERKKREQAINQEYEQEMKLISEKYDSQINICSIQIEELQAQLSSYDKKNVEMAQQQEAAINSQRQIFELEKAEMEELHKQNISDLQNQMTTMQKQMLDSRNASLDALTVQYEAEIAKLDPILDYPIANQIVADVAELNSNKFEPTQFEISLSDEATVAQAQNFLGKLSQDFENFNYVAGLFQSVKWRNTLKDYSVTLVNLANSIGVETVNAAIELLQAQEVRFQQEKESYAHEISSVFKQKNTEYEKYNSAFEAMATRNNHMGYILDVSDSSCMLAFVVDSLKNKVQDGTRASVVDFQGNVVGQGNFLVKGDFLYIVPDSQEQGVLFQPSYELLIDSSTLKAEAPVVDETSVAPTTITDEAILDEGEAVDANSVEAKEPLDEAASIDEADAIEGQAVDSFHVDAEPLDEASLQQEDSVIDSSKTEETEILNEGVLFFHTEGVN